VVGGRKKQVLVVGDISSFTKWTDLTDWIRRSGSAFQYYVKLQIDGFTLKRDEFVPKGLPSVANLNLWIRHIYHISAFR
jgi:hypothetical protein